ncbi:MAG TPA: hypothetical protein IAA45_00870, partial [Candidatus Blautia gallistercoris]|nr:hypothetical protein [Candidatus Blautia gallistercoris]
DPFFLFLFILLTGIAGQGYLVPVGLFVHMGSGSEAVCMKQFYFVSFLNISIFYFTDTILKQDTDNKTSIREDGGNV